MLGKTLTLLFMCVILFPICGQAQITAIRAGRIANSDTGQLCVGLAADVIGTVENPPESANALKGVSFVMKNGFVIKRV